MKCYSCGAEIKESFKFCNKCGAPVQKIPLTADETDTAEKKSVSEPESEDAVQKMFEEPQTVVYPKKDEKTSNIKNDAFEEEKYKFTDNYSSEHITEATDIDRQDIPRILIPISKPEDSLYETTINLHTQSGANVLGKVILEVKLDPELTSILKQNSAAKIQQNAETAKELKTEDSNSSRNLMKRVFMFLEDEEFEKADEYCERVLDMDPYNPMAYLGKLLAEMHVKSISQLDKAPAAFDENKNYLRCLRYADDQMIQQLKAKAALVRQKQEMPEITSSKTSKTSKRRAKSAFVRSLDSSEAKSDSDEQVRKTVNAVRAAESDKAVSSSRRKARKKGGAGRIIRILLITILIIILAGTIAAALLKPELFKEIISKALALI